MRSSRQVRGVVVLFVAVMLLGAWQLQNVVPAADKEDSMQPRGISLALQQLAVPLQTSLNQESPAARELPSHEQDHEDPPRPEAGPGTSDHAPAPHAGHPRAELRRLRPEDQVWVHVAGHVADPGVYYLPAGARVVDALAAAGNATDARVLHHLNLARRLFDEDRVYVPSWQEVQELLAAGLGGWEPYGETERAGPVDLNRAHAEALQRLPGVGPNLAQRIVESRQLEGPFTSVEGATRVPGIGPRTVAQWEGLAVAR